MNTLEKMRWACLPILAIAAATASLAAKVPRVPVINSAWWRICEGPDLGPLNGPDPAKQHVVDHGFIKDSHGNWQLWACIRGTSVGRILYRWEGRSLEQGPWQPKGVALRADPAWGEQASPEKLQAPYMMVIGGRYHCFYNSSALHQLVSEDGVEYRREKVRGRPDNILFPDSGRDVMILDDDGVYYAYSTVTTPPAGNPIRCRIVVRTSPDLVEWSAPRTVCEGGVAGTGPVGAESPFVLKIDGFFYLFRASSHDFKTYVYRSETPLYFGNSDDHNLVAVLPVKAPEIIFENGVHYISDLADFKGVKLAQLVWRATE